MRSGIEITTTIGCSIGCQYCPQRRLIQEYSARSNIRQMTFDTFSTCLKAMSRNQELFFSGFAEPWQNDLCMSMVQYAHLQGFNISAFSTAVPLSLLDVARLQEIHFAKFVIHITGNAIASCGIQNYARIIDSIATAEIAGLRFVALDDPGQQWVIETIAPILAKRNLPMEIWKVNSRAGNIVIGKKQQIRRSTVKVELCKRARRGVLLPNGDVALCCMDWGLQHIIGNLIESSYADIYNGKQFKSILSAGQDSHRDLICKKCEFAPSE